MPKFPSYPLLFDELLSLSVSDLKKLGYLQQGKLKSGKLQWSRYGQVTSSIGVMVDFIKKAPRLRLNYNCNGNKYDYWVSFQSVLSNLGFGEVWFFICPFTHKRCRKLHLINGSFMHRSNLPSGMYESQTKSKSWRHLDKVYGSLFKMDRLYEELYSKHFKTHYNGKPTKRYLRLMEQIQKADKISNYEIESLLRMN
ncbi:hypothetical protein [Aestuariivivens sediminicola]|uniref:hypothetical protein n=1 Tax=Aestuariivivens sediminicola TaxID=2913560 RepID=UPI001F55F683|nr:hypothetical protein [Aestuariivivens sediminicola]